MASESGGSTIIQSVSRAARVFLLVAAEPNGVSAKEVATKVGLRLPTTYHLLTTLVAEGLLVKDSRRRYVLGSKAGIVADAVFRDNRPPEHYRKLLQELADTTEETAYLSAWRGDEIKVLAIIEGARAVRVSGLSTGNGGYPHARASGKLLLAWARPELREQVLGTGRLAKRTQHTIVSRARLDRELATIRQDGYAIDREEYSDGVNCISAPVVEDGFAVATFTVSVPVDRFDAAEEELIQATVETAEKASTASNDPGSGRQRRARPPRPLDVP